MEQLHGKVMALHKEVETLWLAQGHGGSSRKRTLLLLLVLLIVLIWAYFPGKYL